MPRIANAAPAATPSAPVAQTGTVRQQDNQQDAKAMSGSAAVASGYWEGKVFKLREFNCTPASGSVKGVDFAQNMRVITLRHVLKSEVSHLEAKDITLELSSWEIKVRVEGKKELDEHFAAMSGDLHGDVRRELSWWTLTKEADGSSVITLELAKREHKAWNSLWKIGMNHHRKSHFGWTPNSKQPVRKAEDILVKVRPGKPAPREKDPFVIGRENLCAAMEDGQDANTVSIRIHFFREGLDKALESACMGSLFGIDVMEKYIKIFIRGDEKSPILMGELGGKILPHMTRWEIVKAKPPADLEQATGGQQPQNGDRQQLQKSRPQYVNCLQITLAKLTASNNPWPITVHENQYALERDAAPEKLEELKDKTTVRAASPDRTGWSPEELAKYNKAKGDACFKKNDWRDAAVYYGRAINHTPDDHKLYSNRAACYIKLKKFDKALNDARKSASINQAWTKAYFRQGQALRGLERWEDAINAFKEGRFRDARNPDWEKEIEKTEDEQHKWDEYWKEQRRLKREADMTTELNEATCVAEQQAMIAVSQQAMAMGKSRKEAGELAMKGAELAKQRVHEMATKKKAAMQVEDDKEPDQPPPYRIVREDGGLHAKGFCHTDKGMYFMGMVLMNHHRAPGDQPWIELRHPGKMRWSQGCAMLRLKVQLPESVKTAADLEVDISPTRLRIGTVGDSDPVIVGEFDRKVDPEGENYSWYLIPDEKPPMLEMIIDKDPTEVYQTMSYSTLLWLRLFKDDIMIGEGLFEADLTDLPPELLERFNREQALANKRSDEERMRRRMMTEEEVAEETARNWNDEFARHGMPQRLETNEDKMLESMRY